MTKEAQTYDKKFNAERGAKRAGLKPGEYEVFKTQEGRFGWRALAAEPVASAAREAEEAPPADEVQIEADADETVAGIAGPVPAARPTTAKVGKRQAVINQAQGGVLPQPPDFSKPTHARFRAKLAKLVELAEAGDAEGLRAIAINPVSTSPKAMARYRDLAIIAIEARTRSA
jgi:hypothetical protein